MYLSGFITQVKADSLRKALGGALLTNNRKILESEVRSMLLQGGLRVEVDSSSDEEALMPLVALRGKRQIEANPATAANKSEDEAALKAGIEASKNHAALEAATEASKLTAALEASLSFQSADIWPGTLKTTSQEYLKKIHRRHVQRPPDGNCFYTSMLDQVGYSQGWCIHFSAYLSPSLHAFSVVTACESGNVALLVAEMRRRMIEVP